MRALQQELNDVRDSTSNEVESTSLRKVDYEYHIEEIQLHRRILSGIERT